MTTNATDPFTLADLEALATFAEAQDLPPIVRYETHGTIAVLFVADTDAVTQWADRLETEVTTYCGRPATMYDQDGYEMWIAAETT